MGICEYSAETVWRRISRADGHSWPREPRV